MFLRLYHRQDFGLSSTEESLNFRHVGHAGADEGLAKFIGVQRFARQQELDIRQVVFIPACHLGEDEVKRGWAEDGEAPKLQWKSDAAAQPVGSEDDLQFTKQVGKIEAVLLNLGISALLGLPEVQVLIFGSQPRKRKDQIYVARGRESRGTSDIAERQRRAPEKGDFR